jgi:SsrA-binding protein
MLLTKNRKGLYDYEILEKFTAGISLRGYEVKAAREGKVNFEGSYVQIVGGLPVIVNMHIGHYSKQSQEYNDQEARRSRNLLLNKAEVEKLARMLQEKGKTAVPLALILSHNMIKLEFGIAKGRKKAEKKILVKERQIQRDLEITRKSMGI